MSGVIPLYSLFMYVWLIIGELHHLPTYGVVYCVLLTHVVPIYWIGRGVCSNVLNGV